MKNILPLLSLLLAIPSQAEIISRNLVGTAADIRITKNYDIETETGEVVVKLVQFHQFQLLTRGF